MGVIIRQSIRASIFSYLGAIIGYVNVLWLYPYFLEANQIGLLGLIQSSSYLLATFGQVGMGSTLVKFFPELKHQKGLMGAILLIAHLGFIAIVILILVFQNVIVDYFSKQSPLFIEYFQLALIVTYLLVLFQVLEAFCRSILEIGLPTFLRDIGLRTLTTLSIILYGFQLISFHWLIWSLALIYGLTTLVLFLYLKWEKGLTISVDFSFINKKRLRSILNFGFYTLLGAGGTQIILQIDRIMVSGSLGLTETGIYTIAFFIGTVIELPKRAIAQLSMSLLAQNFKEGDMEAVKKLYAQTSINQFIIGALLLLGIWCNLDNVYQFVPNSDIYQKGFYVVLFIGLGKLSDMLFGANGEIIVMSKFYRFNVVAVLSLALLTIAFNQWLIPIYGIEGAALASLLAMTLFNLSKYVFVWIKLGIQPFTYKTVILIIIIGITYWIQWLIPAFSSALLDLSLRSLIITAFFIGPLYLLKVSAEVNHLINGFINKLSRF